jgi:hypothetical protein
MLTVNLLQLITFVAVTVPDKLIAEIGIQDKK